MRLRNALLVGVAALLLGAGASQASMRGCKTVYKECSKWCYDNRSGPEMFQCKNSCRAEFQSALGNGVFRREDGLIERCSASPGVVEHKPKFHGPVTGLRKVNVSY